MGREQEEVFKAALKLPAEARAALAGELLSSLEEAVDEDVEAAWAVEIHRRIAEVESGAVKTVPWAEARKRVMAAAKLDRET
ncbi:MAG: addiction module protein [Deltaproteobacteria bacterium]|nr:addiction module protein [Deltaproteobacteria bacterium]